MSDAYVDAEPGSPAQVTLEGLAARNAGLILLTGGACGPVGAALRRGDRKLAERVLLDLKAAFGDRLYVEISRQDEEARPRSSPACSTSPTPTTSRWSPPTTSTSSTSTCTPPTTC
jgi:DNA polymerase III alpha subunit